MQTKFSSARLLKWDLRLLVFVLAIFIMVSCSKDDKTITAPAGPYSNGFFILNEGWFGHDASSVSFYAYGADTLQQKVFAKENNGSSPVTTSTTLEDGLIIGDRLYLIATTGGAVTVADPATLQQVGRLSLDGADFRSMAAIDASTAVISSGNSIYTVDLAGLTIHTEPVFTGNNIKKLYVSGDYLIASNNKGVDIIEMRDWKSIVHYNGPTEGYVKTPDGMIYGAGGHLLVSIDAVTQDTTQITLEQPIWSNDFAYNAPSLVSSLKENAVFYIAKPNTGFAGTSIYKYVKGSPLSLNTPFVTLPAGETFYGAGLSYDKKNDQIVTCSITGYTQTDKNFLRFYNASTGELVKTIEYGHVYFPANVVFYN